MESVNMWMSGYFQSLKRLLDCPKHFRRHFLTHTRRMAEDFMQGKPDATPQELEAYLGAPQELAQGFLETLDPKILERYHKWKKLILNSCLIALVVSIICIGSWCIHLWSVSDNIEATETIVIYSEFTEGMQ